MTYADFFKATTMAVISLWASTTLAQAPGLPAELSGRWTFASANRSNAFSLEDIKLAADKSFTAVLTWWTTDPACTIRKEPIVGRVLDTGISFDGKTKCNVEFITELSRGEKEWTGKAVTKGANSVTLDVRAK